MKNYGIGSATDWRKSSLLLEHYGLLVGKRLLLYQSVDGVLIRAFPLGSHGWKPLWMRCFSASSLLDDAQTAIAGLLAR